MARLALLFLTVMAMSFIPENFPALFGDWLCEGRHLVNDEFIGCTHLPGLHSSHNPMIHWGFRHYIWFAMGLSLFIYNLVLIINLIDKTDERSKRY